MTLFCSSSLPQRQKLYSLSCLAPFLLLGFCVLLQRQIHTFMKPITLMGLARANPLELWHACLMRLWWYEIMYMSLQVIKLELCFIIDKSVWHRLWKESIYVLSTMATECKSRVPSFFRWPFNRHVPSIGLPFPLSYITLEKNISGTRTLNSISYTHIPCNYNFMGLCDSGKG